MILDCQQTRRCEEGPIRDRRGQVSRLRAVTVLIHPTATAQYTFEARLYVVVRVHWSGIHADRPTPVSQHNRLYRRALGAGQTPAYFRGGQRDPRDLDGATGILRPEDR